MFWLKALAIGLGCWFGINLAFVAVWFTAMHLLSLLFGTI